MTKFLVKKPSQSGIANRPLYIKCKQDEKATKKNTFSAKIFNRQILGKTAENLNYFNATAEISSRPIVLNSR
jgi:hypothetical protein